jgi:hypothetical protein
MACGCLEFVNTATNELVSAPCKAAALAATHTSCNGCCLPSSHTDAVPVDPLVCGPKVLQMPYILVPAGFQLVLQLKSTKKFRARGCSV